MLKNNNYNQNKVIKSVSVIKITTTTIFSLIIDLKNEKKIIKNNNNNKIIKKLIIIKATTTKIVSF